MFVLGYILGLFSFIFLIVLVVFIGWVTDKSSTFTSLCLECKQRDEAHWGFVSRYKTIWHYYYSSPTCLDCRPRSKAMTLLEKINFIVWNEHPDCWK